MDNTPRFASSRIVGVSDGKGKTFFRSASATSALSQQDAENQALALARKRAQDAAMGVPPQTAASAYPYPERVLVEPVLERANWQNGAEEVEIARITCNSYGASVLNAYRAMFVDVDTRPDLLRKPARPEDIVEEKTALALLHQLVAERPEFSFRVYATHSGLRYLCTSHTFNPAAPETLDLMRRLRADPRYITLCRVQKCFRARLTPKPWRCQVTPPRPKGFFARLFSPKTVFQPGSFATCRFQGQFGGKNPPLPEIADLLTRHDTLSEALSNKPLA